jgi:hypothetical protein
MTLIRLLRRTAASTVFASMLVVDSVEISSSLLGAAASTVFSSMLVDSVEICDRRSLWMHSFRDFSTTHLQSTHKYCLLLVLTLLYTVVKPS